VKGWVVNAAGVAEMGGAHFERVVARGERGVGNAFAGFGGGPRRLGGKEAALVGGAFAKFIEGERPGKREAAVFRRKRWRRRGERRDASGLGIGESEGEARWVEPIGRAELGRVEFEDAIRGRDGEGATARREVVDVGQKREPFGLDGFPRDGPTGLAQTPEARQALLLAEEPDGVIGGGGEARGADTGGVGDGDLPFGKGDALGVGDDQRFAEAVEGRGGGRQRRDFGERERVVRRESGRVRC
jgi:hypothetical protein